MQRLPCISDECPLQEHLPSKTTVSNWWVLSPGRPEWMNRTFPVSNVINVLYKEIFWVRLLCWLEFCLQRNLSNEYAEATSVSLINGLFKTIFCLKLSYWFTAPLRRTAQLPPRDLNNEFEEASPVLPMNGLFKTIFPLKLLYWLKALPPLTWTITMQRLPQRHRRMEFSRQSYH